MGDSPGVAERAGLTPEANESLNPHNLPLREEQLMIGSVSVATISLKRRDTWSCEEQTIAHLEASERIPKYIIRAELINLLESSPIDCKVNEIGTDGILFEICNRLPNSGIYQLRVWVCGEEVRGSPFPVTVKIPVNKLGTVIETIDGAEKPWGVAVKKGGEVIVAEESSTPEEKKFTQ